MDRSIDRDDRRDLGNTGYRDTGRDMRDRVDNGQQDRGRGRQSVGGRDSRSDFRNDRDQNISRDHRGTLHGDAVCFAC